jgi:hypothetical protein
VKSFDSLSLSFGEISLKQQSLQLLMSHNLSSEVEKKLVSESRLPERASPLSQRGIISAGDIKNKVKISLA